MLCFRHRGVTFDAENDRPGPGSLRGQFEAARGPPQELATNDRVYRPALIIREYNSGRF